MMKRKMISAHLTLSCKEIFWGSEINPGSTPLKNETSHSFERNAPVVHHASCSEADMTHDFFMMHPLRNPIRIHEMVS